MPDTTAASAARGPCSPTLQENLPPAMAVAAIENGTVVLRSSHAYEATLTLFPAPEPAAVLERYSASASQQHQQQPSASEQPSVQVLGWSSSKSPSLEYLMKDVSPLAGTFSECLIMQCSLVISAGTYSVRPRAQCVDAVHSRLGQHPC